MLNTFLGSTLAFTHPATFPQPFYISLLAVGHKLRDSSRRNAIHCFELCALCIAHQQRPWSRIVVNSNIFSRLYVVEQLFHVASIHDVTFTTVSRLFAVPPESLKVALSFLLRLQRVLARKHSCDLIFHGIMNRQKAHSTSSDICQVVSQEQFDTSRTQSTLDRFKTFFL